MHAYVLVADPAEYYTYEIQNGEATITGYNKELLRSKVLIPQEIEGYPVTTIGAARFMICRRASARNFTFRTM